MALLDEWKKVAYDERLGQEELKKIWAVYFQAEKEIYMQLLKNPMRWLGEPYRSLPTSIMFLF